MVWVENNTPNTAIAGKNFDCVDTQPTDNNYHCTVTVNGDLLEIKYYMQEKGVSPIGQSATNCMITYQKETYTCRGGYHTYEAPEKAFLVTDEMELTEGELRKIRFANFGPNLFRNEALFIAGGYSFLMACFITWGMLKTAKKFYERFLSAMILVPFIGFLIFYFCLLLLFKTGIIG